MAPRKTLLGLTLACLATPAVGHADDSGIVWNGFMNIVAGSLTRESRQDFSDEPQTPTLSGFDGHLDFDQKTSGGLQAQKRLDDKTSVTAQLFAQGATDSYDAKLKWLYVTYEPTFHSSVRIGKLAAPLYYYSDYLNVGYAYHWVTPPEAGYPFDTSLTGIDYVYQDSWKHFDWSGELILGNSNDYFPVVGANIRTHNGRGAAFNVSTGDWLHFRAMVLRTIANFEVEALNPANVDLYLANAANQALDNLNQQGLDPALMPDRSALFSSARQQLNTDAMDLEDVPITYGDIAIVAETERWLLMTEVITVRTNAYLYSNLISKFVTGGYRMDNAMLHLTWSEGRANPMDETLRDRDNTLPANIGVEAVGNVVASQVRSQIAGAFLRNTQALTLGLRLETTPNSAVKFEISRGKELASFAGDSYGVGRNTLLVTALNVTF